MANANAFRSRDAWLAAMQERQPARVRLGEIPAGPVQPGPPFSLLCDGVPAWTRPDEWDLASEPDAPGPERTLRRLAWSHRASGLRCRLDVTVYDRFPALDWVLHIDNTGRGESPLLESILPLDAVFPHGSNETLRLHHANGSLCQMDDFLPQTTELRPGTRKRLAPAGGRSSNGVLPFVNLQHNGGGVVLGIGWSGQWAASFDRSGSDVRVAAGMERTRLRLHPGESIRTPRILALFWDGPDPEAGQNALRRFLLAHVLPRLEGKLVLPPAAQCLQGYYYATGKAGESIELEAVPKAAALGVETYWIDACWYGRTDRQWWEEVGTWVVNTERFPRGLKPISDAAHAAGMNFVLWFEPERVRPASLLAQEHPEFLLRCEQDRDNLLLNLGDPAARRHITDLVSRRIEENGVDVYRQDFNFDPLPYWQAADAPDRVGMTEIRHIEGLYEFWDELRRRHPRLWIDNCASGGRRIDLELLSRSLPLWPSDFTDVPGLGYGWNLHAGDQCINAGLARWVPLFGGGVWRFDPYATRSQIVGGFTFGMHLEQDDYVPPGGDGGFPCMEVLARGRTLFHPDFPHDAARAAIAEWKSVREFFLGDLHLLLPLTAAPHDWCAMQFHRSDLAAGCALFFRRHRSPYVTIAAGLRQIDPDADYEVSLSPGYEEGARRRLAGRELAALPVTLEAAPSSLLLRYRRLEHGRAKNGNKSRNRR